MLTWVSNKLVRWFPVLSLSVGILALFEPKCFLWFGSESISIGLGLIMLGMGMTLEAVDFVRVFRNPKIIALGLAAQYGIMPVAGWGISILFDLPKEIALGLIMVSCCPGGTASNVVVYLAKGGVALSVALTLVSTFLAVFLTPSLVLLFAGQYVPVDPWGLFRSVVVIVLFPLIVGLVWNRFFSQSARKISSFSPIISVLFILLIVGYVISAKNDLILQHWGKLLLSVSCLHLLGFSFGYFLAKLFGMEELVRRTISIEVGMQNSGLGMALTSKHFSQFPLAPAPCAISAVFHCIMGSIIACRWSQKKI